MSKLVLALTLLALSGCAGVDQGQSSLDPADRAALLGAMIANQPHPYYPQPYAMPVQQNRSFNCMRAGNMVSCY